MATGAIIAGTAMFAGSVLSAYAQKKAGEAELAAAEGNARVRQIQAQELLERAKINSEQLRLKGKVFSEVQLSNFVRAGVELDSTSTITALTDTAKKVQQEIEFSEREAEFQANQLMLQGSIDLDLGRKKKKASDYAAIGSILGGGGRIGTMFTTGR